MKKALLIKSSFTLPASEIALVNKLREMLNLKSNTQVIRKALYELMDKFNRQKLRLQFKEASQLVREANQRDMEELDQLAEEGLE